MTLVPAHLVGDTKVFLGDYLPHALKAQGAVSLGNIHLTGALEAAYNNNPADRSFELDEFKRMVGIQMNVLGDAQTRYQDVLNALE